MADEERSIWNRLNPFSRSEPIARSFEIKPKNDIDWDGKALASMTQIGMATQSRSGNGIQRQDGADTAVSYHLLKQIATKSEVVNAILRRCVDDTLSNGYRFKLREGIEEGDQAQLEKVRDFFKNPNPDDMGDEWLESLLFDLILFGDAYLELSGTDDSSDNNGEDWDFGGDLEAIWPIPSETMKLVPAPQTPQPPEMAYIQTIDRNKRRFTSNKVIHITKFKQGRGYGQSPLIPLLETISGHLNLSNYMNALYTGTLPKTILNVGDISNSEMKSMLALIEQQLNGGQSPFGLIAINGGTGFNMHRMLDTNREGAQMDLLYYYREEICAVFGIPPMKLGWVQTGKLANPEQQLDAWYDVVESYHSRLQALINNKILPLLEISDYIFDFVSIRPSRETERAETLNAQSNAIATLRQEGAISLNEAREILGLDKIMDDRANDPFFLSPKLSINAGAGNVPTGMEGDGPPDDDVAEAQTLASKYPAPPRPDDEGANVGDFVAYNELEVESQIDEENFEYAIKAIEDLDLEEIMSDYDTEMYDLFSKNQRNFSDKYITAILERFGSIQERSFVSKDLDPDEVDFAVRLLDEDLTDLLDQNIAAAGTTMTSGYGATLAATGAAAGIDLAFTRPDTEALSYWSRRWVVPALRNTLGAYRGEILDVFEQAQQEGKNWDWVAREMRRKIDPTGTLYPKYWYERIARTELRRVVENAHLSGLIKMGFTHVIRNVTIDMVTDQDTCVPFENAVYNIREAGGVIPAHPNCRCSFSPIPTDEKLPSDPVPEDDVLRPDVEGAEETRSIHRCEDHE